MSMSVEEQRERARKWAAQNLGVGRTNLTGVLTSIPTQNIAHERQMERDREYERNINRVMDLRQNQNQNQQEQPTDETVPGHYNQMHDIVMKIQNANNNQGNQGNQGGRNIKKSRKSKKCKRKSSRRRFRKNHSKKYK